MTPRDRSPFNAGKMGAGRAKAREIPHARHDFPHYRRGIQLLMANPSSCAGGGRNLAENPVPYRTIPHAWAFRPLLLWPGRHGYPGGAGVGAEDGSESQAADEDAVRERRWMRLRLLKVTAAG